MPTRSLKFRYHEGAGLPEGRLREIWALRVEMLDLVRSPEEDWRYFSAFVRRDDTAVMAFYDHDEAIQGFFTISYVPVEHLGRKGLLLFSKYFYFRRAYRGHYKTMLAPWLLLPIAWRRHGLRRVHFVTSTYPQSFVSLSRSSGNAVALHSAEIGPWQRAALRGFARAFYGDDFDEPSGIIRNQNVVSTPGLPQSEPSRRLAAEYERLNPDWRDGCSLPIIFSLDGGLVRAALARTLRRLRPRARATVPAAP